jgi:hypothetical protein
MDYISTQNYITELNPMGRLSMVKQWTWEHNPRLSPTDRRGFQMRHVGILFDYWAWGIESLEGNLCNPLLQRWFINVN